MKGKRILNFLLTSVFYVLVSQFSVQAQFSFRLEDPNLVFKDKNGNILSVDSVKALIENKTFSIKQTPMKDGKTEIVIMLMSSDDIHKMHKEEDDWMSKWKNARLPDFALKNLKGETISNADIKGKWAVINFWFIACKPCVNEMPDLNKLKEKYKDQPIIFLAPSFDDVAALQGFLEKKTFNYTVLANAKELTDKMSVYAYPTHLVVDKDGIIREIIVGGPDVYNRLDALIQQVIKSGK